MKSMRTSQEVLKTTLFRRCRLSVLAPALMLLAVLAPALRAAPQYGIVKSFGDPLRNANRPTGRLLEARDGYFYGPSRGGGEFLAGTIYRIARDGTGFGVVYGLPADSQGLLSPIVEDEAGMFYGTLSGGTVSTVWSFERSTGKMTVLKTLPGDPSYVFYTGLLLASDGMLYGVGDADTAAKSIIYRLNRDGGDYQVLRTITGTGSAPRWCRSALTEGSDGLLYGTSQGGGSTDGGTVYRLAKDGTGFQVVVNFRGGNPSNRQPAGGVTEGSDGRIYGLLSVGTSQDGDGALWSAAKNGTGVVYASPFNSGVLHRPVGELIEAPDGRLYGGATNAVGTNSGLFVINKDFSGLQPLGEGLNPFSVREGLQTPVLSGDGKLYTVDTAPDRALITRVTPGAPGAEVLHFFSNSGGQAAPFRFIEGPDRWLYGMSLYPSPPQFWKMRRDGTEFRVIRTFEPTALDSYGGAPVGDLNWSDDGFIYSWTQETSLQPGGTVVRLSPVDGSVETVLTFPQIGPGTAPGNPTAVLRAGDGMIYGTTRSGGENRWGTVFRASADGTGFIVLHDFTNTDTDSVLGLQEQPDGRLYGYGGQRSFHIGRDGTNYQPFANRGLGARVEGEDGWFFGASGIWGNGFNDGVLGKVRQDGSDPTVVKQFVASGTALYGAGPVGIATDGTVYGVLNIGGAANYGGLYRIHQDGGGYEVLHEFTEGEGVTSTGLVSSGDNNVYGLLTKGGKYGFGAIFQYGESNEITVEDAQGGNLFSGQGTQDFGTRLPGDTVPPLVLTVKNTGTLPLALTGVRMDGGAAGDYAVDPLTVSSLAPGARTEVTVRFAPRLGGTRAAVLNLLSDDYDESLFAVPLTAEVPAPEIVVRSGEAGGPELQSGQAAVLDFGETRQPQSVTRRFVLSNTGGAALQISGVTVPAGFTFTLSATSVPAGGSADLDVVLTGAPAGVFTGNVVVLNDDPDEGTFTFPVSGTVVTPEIVVRDGASPESPELGSGQQAVVDFGTVRKQSPLVRPFTVYNTGTAPLLISAVSVPPGFSAPGLPALPVTVAPGGTFSLTLQAEAAETGNFTGQARIASDDLDESDFAFPVAVMVVTPEIAVHDGPLSGPELSSGQSAPVDFGRNIQGTPGIREITLANTGTAPLLVFSVTVPEGFSLNPAPALPVTVPPGGAVGLEFSLVSLTAGTHAGVVMIQNDDLDEGGFSFPLSGEVFIPAPVATVPAKTTTLNRQTGFREQTVHLANDTTATVPGYRLVIRGLPAGVSVANAAEVRADGSVVVLVTQALAPHSAFDLVLEYASATRQPADMQPEITVEVVLDPGDSVPADGTGTLAVERLVPMPGGGMLLEFTARAGARYEVQYSGDGSVWKTSPVPVQAGGNRCQWIDCGPPCTDSPPDQAGSRFYRVREAVR